MSTSRITKPSITALGILAAALAVGACGEDDGDEPSSASATQVESSLPQGSEPSNLNPDEFTTQIDNPYLPYKPGSKWVYSEVEGNEELMVEVTVLDETKQIANGVTARVVRDTVTDAKTGDLVEDTDDWYAQDADGNVWYLGEDTKELENGEVVSTKGSWQAGVNHARAGIFMPAQPQVGQVFKQEDARNVAEDCFKIVDLNASVKTPFVTSNEALQTGEFSLIEPGLADIKHYVRGIGLVRDQGASDFLELVSVTGP